MRAKQFSTSIIALFIFIVILGMIFFPNDKSKLIQQINRHGLVDHRYDRMVHNLFQFIASEMEMLPVSVNNGYYQDSLCIYIIQTKDIHKNDEITGDIKRYLDEVSDTFIAIPPNIVLVDSKFLALCLLCAQNQCTSSVNAWSVYESFQDDDKDSLMASEMYKMKMIDTYLRYKNIEVYKSGNQWYEQLDSLVSLIPKTYSDMAQIDTFYGTVERSSKFISFYFSMIIAHELAHLKLNPRITNIPTFIQKVKSTLLRLTEEKRADDIAINVVKRLREKQKAENESAFENFLSDQEIIAFVELLRDLILYKVFDNYNGAKPYDILLTLTEKYPLNAENEKLDFINPSRINTAEWNPPPALSAKDLDSIITRIQSSSSSLMHQHLLKRATRLFQEIFGDYVVSSETIFHGYDKLLNVPFGEDKVEIIKILSESALFNTHNYSGLGVSLKELIKTPPLDSIFKLELCLPMNGEKCWRTSINDIKIELRGQEDDLTQITIVRKFYPNIQDSISVVKNIHSNFIAIALLRKFFHNDRDVKKFLRQHERFFDGLKKGDCPHLLYQFGNALVSFGVVNEFNQSELIRIKISGTETR